MEREWPQRASAAWDTVRTLVDDIRPTIVCLQEIKLDVICQATMFSMLGLAFLEFAYLPVSKTCGGILIVGRQSDVSSLMSWSVVTQSWSQSIA
jgi:hypothetical protein